MAKKSIGAKSAFAPMPVLLVGTYDADGNPDIMNVAWGGQCGPKHIAINIGSHKSTENLKASKEFTVGLANRAQLVAADYVGIVSGNKVPDKVARSGFTVTKAENVNAPIIDQLPVTMECKVIDAREELGETRFVGEIVNTVVDESALDAEGNLDLGRADLIAFDTAAATYRTLGESVGKAFGDGKQLIK